MIPRSCRLPLLAAFLLFLGVCAARDVATSNNFAQARDSEGLWKRRIHHSDSDSDSSSSSDSSSDTTTSSSTSSNINDDDDDDGDDDTSTGTSSSDTRVCTKTKTSTRILTNDDGYGPYSSSGIGSENSTSGGSTRNGSGTAPRFDNSTGAWTVVKDDAAANDVDNENQKYLNYLGGAAVPYKSGDDSPNGVSSKRVDNLAFATVDEDNSTYSLSSGNVPVYCACNPYGLCRCGDFHKNSSFVPTMLSYLGLDREAKNVSKLCTVSIDGTTTTLIDGGLSNGSTKADPDADAVFTRVPTSRGGRCPSGSGGDSAAPKSISVNGGLLLAWTSTLSLGMAFGMSLIWL
ncbi:hypothetical protein BJY01DRAFT_254288 [Aspergillus pseudoustus]|uniref:DUF7732 domain-containing protein n=1 Tax=Aspergillus pseudoustus TaxID=1810923 RepID=A0ABR4IUC2_9EURO